MLRGSLSGTGDYSTYPCSVVLVLLAVFMLVWTGVALLQSRMPRRRRGSLADL